MSLTVFGEIDDRRVGLLDLPGVLFDVLIGFLQPIDIIMSRNVNKKIHREISSNFVLSSFRRNLAKLVSNCGYSGLVQRDNDVLRPGKSILSGSIVLQAVLGEEWVGSDIDLYATFDYITRVRSKFYHDMGFMYAAWPDDNDVDDQCCDYLISKIGSVLESVEVWKSTEAKEPSWKTASDGLNKAHGYCNLSQKSAGSLQVMALKADVGMAEEAIRGFDLDIVMNTFDGTTLFITNPFSIASRVAHTSEYVHMMSQALGDVADPSVDKMDRLDNLSEKGVFRWGTRCGLDEEDHRGRKEFLKDVFELVFRRLIKYNQRGFTISMQNDEPWTKKQLEEVMFWCMNKYEADTESEHEDVSESDDWTSDGDDDGDEDGQKEGTQNTAGQQTSTHASSKQAASTHDYTRW